MRPLIIALLSFSLCGCVVECIQAKIDRPALPIPGNHVAELRVAGLEPIRKTITCEKYYDAICAERGNYWTVREVGTADESSPSRMSVEIGGIGKVEVLMPACKALVGHQPSSLKMPIIYIDGHSYFYAGTDGPFQIYKKAGKKVTEQETTIRIQFQFFVDGQVIG